MRLKYWEWIYALSFCCFQFQLIAVAQITDPAEVSALMAIKSNLVDPLKHLKNWNKGDPCVSNWTGVLCFDAVRTDGYLHVRELQLLNMNLSGTLAPELGQFSQLEILDFMWNDLRGSIPKEIGNIASLKLILLNGNNLSGPLPAELGYLSNLNRLQIDQNNISGTIPESFSNLNSVRHIHLNNNSLSGQIPPQLSNLSTLLHMLLDNNNLTGYLPPEFSNFPELRILQLDNNNFSGAEIPTSYGSLSALVKLSLRNCSLEGAVPDLSGIANLSYLDLSQNQLSGYIPSNPLSPSMTTIELSNNQLNGSIPDSYSDLPSLQKFDLQNNSLSNITGNLNPLENVILRLQGNPICSTSNIRNKDQICGPEAGGDDIAQKSTNSTMICPIHACPIDNNFEYVPASPLPCFCASPLRIGYRLKSPSFSYFAPYVYQFEMYLTRSLNLDLYQLSIESFVWEKGPRLGMYLKLFPLERNLHSSIFNTTEIIRIRDIFTSWKFPGSDLFGPYELLNFTLGPYSFVNHETQVKNISKGILIAIVLPAIAVAATISALLTLFIARRKARNRHTLSRKHFSSKLYIKIDGVKSFSFREMELATDHFDSSTQVGQGGYGNVYRGILADDTIVAIKRAKEGSLQGQKEFLTEIEMLSRLHHRNLVSLVGYCDEEGEQMLVYEFMTNGSLQDWLSAKSKGTLNFGVRLQVALGSAKGILYLHTEVHPPIFHRDIKASNILLDSKLTAKVSDFGLSQLAPVMDDEGTEPVNVSTIVKGTPGYLDPEYLLTRKVTDKSDVYSLGVVFLEILTGMRPISHGKNIVREVNLAHESGTMFAVIDSRMGSYPSECVERFVALALRCCQDKPEQRPSMLDVVRELENILRMMPETGLDLSVSESSYFGESTPSSSLAFVSRDPVSSSNMLGSDLVSGSIPSIIPR
ncbi:probable LRR receptor-like serine/threonine-protein kinase At1g06840 isoform X2 [Rhododendron vialii]|uniref:probable LRR receptor-like serine/threonine-protein kinase At1g06840 isoform X2 n=1 Tax=Rhododendron vialii TaxID=182163 RepID=UPI00265F795D|nr:probable LRR receptor-like serine/threonine-protein kinase At1g06840 isoform X2 [Rhododendron vialii]